MSEKSRHRMKPTWEFPFRVGPTDCVFVSETVWRVRWTRVLTREQKLLRAQRFMRATRLALQGADHV